MCGIAHTCCLLVLVSTECALISTNLTAAADPAVMEKVVKVVCNTNCSTLCGTSKELLQGTILFVRIFNRMPMEALYLISLLLLLCCCGLTIGKIEFF
jgi:hypothetical protein